MYGIVEDLGLIDSTQCTVDHQDSSTDILHPFSFNVSKYGLEPANLQNTNHEYKI